MLETNVGRCRPRGISVEQEDSGHVRRSRSEVEDEFMVYELTAILAYVGRIFSC